VLRVHFFNLYLVVILLCPHCCMQIPNWFGGESTGSTKSNPFTLPDAYMASQNKNVCILLIDEYMNYWISN